MVMHMRKNFKRLVAAVMVSTLVFGSALVADAHSGDPDVEKDTSYVSWELITDKQEAAYPTYTLESKTAITGKLANTYLQQINKMRKESGVDNGKNPLTYNDTLATYACNLAAEYVENLDYTYYSEVFYNWDEDPTTGYVPANAPVVWAQAYDTYLYSVDELIERCVWTQADGYEEDDGDGYMFLNGWEVEGRDGFTQVGIGLATDTNKNKYVVVCLR